MWLDCPVEETDGAPAAALLVVGASVLAEAVLLVQALPPLLHGFP
jgi:hypothetical protein